MTSEGWLERMLNVEHTGGQEGNIDCTLGLVSVMGPFYLWGVNEIPYSQFLLQSYEFEQISLLHAYCVLGT